MNYGGFSWRRLLGISAAKSRISRTIGIPLTASGRRRKLGASVFNAFGSVVGTLALAAVAAAKQREKPDEDVPPSQPPTRKGGHFCLVKGVTHSNDDGTSRAAAQQLCSIGDTVKLIPEPNNEHDRHAIRVVLQTGQQIGYIGATQAARFEGKVHLLTATVHSRVKDEWGNDTVKLRVVNSAEQPAYDAYSSTAKNQSSSVDLIPAVQAIQAEAKEEAKKHEWQSTLIYFENAERGQYQVVLAENTEHMRQTLQEGLIQVGYIGGHDAPKGIQFEFSLDDGIPTNGIVAKRFLANAGEWVATRSKDLCAQKGIAVPIVHDFEFNCQSCGSVLTPNARFCRRCGRPVTPTPAVVPSPTEFIVGHGIHDLPRPPAAPTTWGPKLGSGAANYVNWCKQNPGWCFFLLIATVGIVGNTAKRSYEQTTARSFAYATPPPGPGDTKPGHITDDERNYIGAASSYLKIGNEEARLVARIMAGASNGSSTLGEIRTAISSAKRIENAGYQGDYVKRINGNIPGTVANLAANVEETHHLFQAAMKEMLEYWNDQNTAHINSGSDALQRCVMLMNDTISQATEKMKQLSESDPR